MLELCQLSKIDMKKAQNEDPVIRVVREIVEGGTETKIPEEVAGEVKLLLRQRNNLFVDTDNVLKRHTSQTKQIVLPSNLKEELIYKHRNGRT